MFEGLSRLVVGYRQFVASLVLRWDAWRFQRGRADYYEYLADLIHGLQGRKTLRDLFEDDARRYGAGTVRGRLTAYWARAYQDSGGSLSLAWAKTMTASECMLIAAAQAAGGGALSLALRDLSHAARLLAKAQTALFSTLVAGVAAVLVAVLLICAVPFFSVPRLQHVFQTLPGEYYGVLTKALFGMAQALDRWLPFSLVCVAGGAGIVLWSLPNLTGRLRQKLDSASLWRLYRDFHAIRFLAMLSVLVRQRGNIDTRLRQALVAQGLGATPWFAAHVREMVWRVDAGIVGAETFDTGLLDREIWWFMSDMMASNGVEEGLLQVRERIESSTLNRVCRQAQVLRWGLLLAAVSTVIGLALWHYSVIDELRRALISFYASR